MSDWLKGHTQGFLGFLNVGQRQTLPEYMGYQDGLKSSPFNGEQTGGNSGAGPGGLIFLLIPMLAPFWMAGMWVSDLVAGFGWSEPLPVVAGVAAGVGGVIASAMLWSILPRPIAAPVFSLYTGASVTFLLLVVLKLDEGVFMVFPPIGAVVGYVLGLMMSNPRLHHRLFTPLIALAAGLAALAAPRLIGLNDATGMTILMVTQAASGLVFAAAIHAMIYSKWTFFGGIALIAYGFSQWDSIMMLLPAQFHYL